MARRLQRPANASAGVGGRLLSIRELAALIVLGGSYTKNDPRPLKVTTTGRVFTARPRKELVRLGSLGATLPPGLPDIPLEINWKNAVS